MDTPKAPFFGKAMEWVSIRSNGQFKANFEEHERPASFTNKDSEESFMPDISFSSHGGGRSFTEIAVKQVDEKLLVSRWKLLATIATVSNGKLFLLTPKGHKLFTQRLVDAHSINAVVKSI